MRLESLLIGMFVIAIVSAGMYTFIGNVGDQYDVVTDEDSHLAIYENSYALGVDVNESFNRLTSDDTSKTAQFFTGVVLVWNTIVFIVQSIVGSLNIIINNILIALFLPEWFIGIAYGVIAVMIIFAMIALIMRWKP